MNNMPNVLDVAKAQKHRSTFPLDFQHLTTMDFGKTSVVHSKELMPNDKVDIDVSLMCQLAPMVVPTMGSVNCYLRGFFAPYRFVWKHWESFFMGREHPEGSLKYCTHVPQLTNVSIWEMFHLSQYEFSTIVNTSIDAQNYDFMFRTSDGVDRFYKFTAKGRAALQILVGLGYPFSVVDSRDESGSGYGLSYSALPLLSLVKVFRDYYVNPNFDYTLIDSILNDDMLSDVSTHGYQLTPLQLGNLVQFCLFGWYESDIFTSAWANPEMPGYSTIYNSSAISVPQSFNPYNTIIPANQNDSVVTNMTYDFLSQTGLNMLKAVRNFILRRSVSGARFVDQLLSRFGIRLNESEARRSIFIGSAEYNPEISRVDATAAGQNGDVSSSLGEFTGRGIMKGNGHFYYENTHNDFGQLLFISHMLPRTSYYQGIKPENLHMSLNDFFQPDFEDVGNAPIPNMVVCDDLPLSRSALLDTDAASFLPPKGVFGFAPNYYEYKTQFDYLSGDFRCRSINSELRSFDLMRKLNMFYQPAAALNVLPSDLVEGTTAMLGEQFMIADGQSVDQFNRLWLNQTDDADHFICSWFFKVRATRDCNSLGNSLLAELNEHGNDVGDVIKVRPNGKYF